MIDDGDSEGREADAAFYALFDGDGDELAEDGNQLFGNNEDTRRLADAPDDAIDRTARLVRDTSAYPMSAVCRIAWNGVAWASGVAIGPKTILTAGHVLLGDAEPALAELRVEPRHDERVGGASYSVVGSVIHPSWKAGRNALYDLAIVYLDEVVGHYVNHAENALVEAESFGVVVIGYDRLNNPGRQTYANGAVRENSGSLAGYDAPTYIGQSGGAVFVRKRGVPRLLATHVGDYRKAFRLFQLDLNKGVYYPESIHRWIASNLDLPHGPMV